jgi:hypothetical protein
MPVRVRVPPSAPGHIEGLPAQAKAFFVSNISDIFFAGGGSLPDIGNGENDRAGLNPSLLRAIFVARDVATL